MSLRLDATIMSARRNGDVMDLKTFYVPALPVPGTYLRIGPTHYLVLDVTQDVVGTDDFDLAIQVTVAPDPAADLLASERYASARALLGGRR